RTAAERGIPPPEVPSPTAPPCGTSVRTGGCFCAGTPQPEGSGRALPLWTPGAPVSTSHSSDRIGSCEWGRRAPSRGCSPMFCLRCASSSECPHPAMLPPIEPLGRDYRGQDRGGLECAHSADRVCTI